MFKPLSIEGAFAIQLQEFRDVRGAFTKVHHQRLFEAQGLRFEVQETYVSRSHRGVVRGLHFQVPPSDHAKLVTLLEGAAFDVLVDLRVGSPTFGKHTTIALDGIHTHAVFVPSGLAHGFQALQENTTLLYQCSTVHDPACDAGIHWESAGIPWPLCDSPILSGRDQLHPSLAAFESPFTWSPQ